MDILSLRRGAWTHFMFASRLGSQGFSPYFDRLLTNGFLEEDPFEVGTYRTTPLGEELLTKLQDLSDMLEVVDEWVL